MIGDTIDHTAHFLTKEQHVNTKKLANNTAIVLRKAEIIIASPILGKINSRSKIFTITSATSKYCINYTDRTEYLRRELEDQYPR